MNFFLAEFSITRGSTNGLAGPVLALPITKQAVQPAVWPHLVSSYKSEYIVLKQIANFTIQIVVTKTTDYSIIL